MVWERCSPKPWLLLGDTWTGETWLKGGGARRMSPPPRPPPPASLLTVFPVNVTGGDCQEMLKPAPLVGVKPAHAEPLLLPLDGMDTGAVAWGGGRDTEFTLATGGGGG